MTKVGIVVDGQGDYAALKARFKDRYRIVKTDGARGHEAPISKIAKSSLKQILILKGLKCSKIIILLDFEARTTSYSDFLSEMENAFSYLCADITVHVAAPNRMIENWFLADIAYLSSKKAFLRNGLGQKNYEGKNGKAEIKRLFVKNATYNEIIHGAQMFATIRFDVASSNSPSFAAFCQIIKSYK
jgi:5S rRNA maturation endonuclease (ribonuclease M5)